MIAENSDREALIAQADIYRLYARIIQPALAEFGPTADIVSGEMTDIEAFLEAARANTNTELCYEIRRDFALIIGALFERQLQFWLSGKISPSAVERKRSLSALLSLVDNVDNTIVTHGIKDDLNELCLVANVVRHGSGRSAEELESIAPRFWNHRRISPDLVGNMRIGDNDLQKYAKAVIKFWHRAGASPLP